MYLSLSLFLSLYVYITFKYILFINYFSAKLSLIVLRLWFVLQAAVSFTITQQPSKNGLQQEQQRTSRPITCFTIEIPVVRVVNPKLIKRRSCVLLCFLVKAGSALVSVIAVY